MSRLNRSAFSQSASAWRRSMQSGVAAFCRTRRFSDSAYSILQIKVIWQYETASAVFARKAGCEACLLFQHRRCVDAGPPKAGKRDGRWLQKTKADSIGRRYRPTAEAGAGR